MQNERTESASVSDVQNVAFPGPVAPSNLGHELRNPLAAIQALSEIMRDNPDMASERRQEFLGKVVDEAKRLARCIDRLLYNV